MTTKKPVILQVLPSLQSGGVERGTIEVARAIAAKGWTPLVASSGGKMAAQLSYQGIEHITLPLCLEKSFCYVDEQPAAEKNHPRAQCRYHPRPFARAGLERVFRSKKNRLQICHYFSRILQNPEYFQALV
jgi:hypothetical protein